MSKTKVYQLYAYDKDADVRVSIQESANLHDLTELGIRLWDRMDLRRRESGEPFDWLAIRETGGWEQDVCVLNTYARPLQWEDAPLPYTDIE